MAIERSSGFSTGLIVFALAAASAYRDAPAEPAASRPPTVTELMSREVDGPPDRQALMLTVSYAPGGSSLPHRHDAYVFVYVLEGAMTMQLDGGVPVTIKAGQTFFEGPSDVHRISANASRTQSAKILVFMLKARPSPRALAPGAAP